MNILSILLGVSITLAASPLALAESGKPNPAPHLSAIESRDFDAIYVAPDDALAAFDTLYVMPPEVTFREHWLRDQNRYHQHRIRERDAERIRERMAGLMQEAMSEEFSEHGWALAEAPGPGVLVVRPNIVELDVVAPDVRDANRSYSFSESAGAMTLDLEMTDGATGQVLLRAEDRRRDPRAGFLEWRTEAYNTAVARRMIKGWARDLRHTVDEHRGAPAKG